MSGTLYESMSSILNSPPYLNSAPPVSKAFMASLKNPHLADFVYEKLIEQIQGFENELDDNSEVAIQLASFGSSVLMSVTEIGYQNPDMLYFHGFVNGNRAQLIQHISQLNFLLMSVAKSDPNCPPRRIGFAVPSED